MRLLPVLLAMMVFALLSETASPQPRALAEPVLSLDISPTTIDPAQRQSATITYINTVPVYTPRVTVYDGNGEAVRVVASFSMIGTRTRTTTWDGTDDTGSVAPDGTYTVVFSGNTRSREPLPMAVGTISVASTPPLSLSLDPDTIDPTAGETTTITYTNTVSVYTPRVTVYDAVGKSVRVVASFDMIGKRTRTTTWDGTNEAGDIVPDGSYTVVYSGYTRKREALPPATATVTIATGPQYAFAITGIEPKTVDPTPGESTTITYTVPIPADFRLSVTNDLGVEVRALYQGTNVAAGTYTATWDTKDDVGSVVPNGTYTVTIEGLNASTDITPASSTLNVAATPPPTYAFSITSIEPGTIDPTKGESTTITYDVPVACDLRVYVQDSAGAEVLTLDQLTGTAAGPHTATWNAGDGAGIVVPNGDYTVIVESLSATPIVTPAGGTVTVAASPPPVYAFSITSIVPETIDPTPGESATITYEVPKTADYRLYITNEAGVEVRALYEGTNVAVGTYIASWDAKDDTGDVVSNGTYTVTIEGLNTSTDIIPANGAVYVSASPPPVYAFAITSIVPETIDPTLGESATITYEVPITADYRIYVTNEIGGEVLILDEATNIAAGTYTTSWDAKDDTRAVVPSGTYTVTIEGLNASADIIAASGTIYVSASPPPTYAFSITSLVPETIDPTLGESTTITYEVPITADYRIYVSNEIGGEVLTLYDGTNIAAGTYTAAWDAKDNEGTVVPSGTYTVTIEGLNASTTITPASGTIYVSASPPPVYAFAITGIAPATIDPTLNESTTITYEVPVATDYHLYVTDEAGTHVRSLVEETNAAADTYTATWDAKDDAGAAVPNGTYTVAIEGLNASTNITPASGTVYVSASSPPVYAFSITSIDPGTIDPTNGESTTITYEVPVTADYHIYITDGAGIQVCTLVEATAAEAGTYTATWDAKDDTGVTVPDGTYTITIEGLNASTGITPAAGTVTVTASPPAYVITELSPGTINPLLGEVVTVTFTNPITSDCRIFVTDGTGAEVCTIGEYTALEEGSRTCTWNGLDGAGNVVAEGVYTITVRGMNGFEEQITPDSAGLAISHDLHTLPATGGGELGQTIEGAGSASFSWLRYPGCRLDIAFRAPRDGTITQITLQWKKSSGYGSNSYGLYTFELQTNGEGNFPSGTIIATTESVDPVAAMDGYLDGAFHFPITATLFQGEIYHLVVTNVDANPRNNWSSPNGLMTRVLPWSGDGNRAAVYMNGQWLPWSSVDNVWNTSGGNFVNGEHLPTLLTWDDGVNTGDPYYSSMLSGGAYFNGDFRAGEYIVWDKPATEVHRIGLSVKRIGTPAGPLRYHLEQVDGVELATGIIADAGKVQGVQQWVYATLPSGITLKEGTSYRLWFESPDSTNKTDCYFTSPVYGESRPAEWLECGWGGTASYYISGSGNLDRMMPIADLSFSLQ